MLWTSKKHIAQKSITPHVHAPRELYFAVLNILRTFAVKIKIVWTIKNLATFIY